MKNMVTTEEALKELISRIPDEVLSEAIGGMSDISRSRLIKLGLVAAVVAAGYSGYRWYNSRNAGEGQSEGVPAGCTVTEANKKRQEELRKNGFPKATVYTNKNGGTHTIFGDDQDDQ